MKYASLTNELLICCLLMPISFAFSVTSFKAVASLIFWPFENKKRRLLKNRSRVFFMNRSLLSELKVNNELVK
ncbi:MAG TPA: hypothetical protein DCX70_07045 [Chitinophagaceae bacterium]|nr:hypothetical protein [Chitinophagaceae bacterium]